jgi:DNA modification methylase
MNGQIADLIHADPPYGMGKEKDGVENDNLYAEKLDAFQIAWFKAFRPHVADNAGLYIWGNTEDLWRLWFEGSLKDVERMTFRNEIVWSKKGGMGIGSGKHRSYPTTTERCLFIMLGEQGFNSNADNYWDGWESIRLYLDSEIKKCGWSIAQVNEIVGLSSMAQHWLTRSQWTFIVQKYYVILQEAAKPYGALKRDYDSLKRDYDSLKRDYDSLRAYFDNTHENMTDVWEYSRVHGEERHGHATPKAVQMMARVMKSSLPKDGLCVEPFGGSGSTLIGAEQTDRVCYTMELTPAYVDIIIERWENLTGQKAELVS